MAVSDKKLYFERLQKQVMRESSEHTSERAQQANHRNELELAEQTQLSRWREIRQTSKYPSKYSKKKSSKAIANRQRSRQSNRADRHAQHTKAVSKQSKQRNQSAIQPASQPTNHPNQPTNQPATWLSFRSSHEQASQAKQII